MAELRMNPTKNADVLSNVLRLLRFKANIYFHSTYCGEWTLDASGTGRSTFHVVAEGKCWLHMQQLEKPIQLSPGDLLIFPNDASHIICPYEVLLNLEIKQPATLDLEDSTALICGYFEFDVPRSNPVIEALPDWVLIKHQEAHDSAPWLQQIVALMILEAEKETVGIEATLDKLSELLFIHVVRHLISTGKTDKGIFVALGDSRLSQVLKAIHTNPQHHWKVEGLASIANMSRSAFSAHFLKALGSTPLQYITHWRMQIAYAELLESQRTITDIAEFVGYGSEAAFRKAFKSTLGITPGSVRTLKR